MHRKLFHPRLGDVHQRRDPGGIAVESRTSVPAEPGRHSKRRQAPPDRTCAEEFYYVKQMSLGTPLGVVMASGESFRGTIEWYDRGCIHFLPESGPPRMLYKNAVQYFYKLEEEDEVSS